jgi:hypothetical protein
LLHWWWRNPTDARANEARNNAAGPRSFPADAKIIKGTKMRQVRSSPAKDQPPGRLFMGRALLLWLLGVPIPIIIILALLFR